MQSRRYPLFFVLASVVISSNTFAQSTGEKAPTEKFAVFLISGTDSSSVTQALSKKMADSKPFETVSKEEVSKAVVIVDCMHRDKSISPFICMYIAHYNGVAFKTLLGAGEYISQTADDMADNLLAAIASDIVERWDETDKRNLRESLEACLLLTESKCNVPTPLQAEYGEKQLTLVRGPGFFSPHQRLVSGKI